MGGGGCGIAMLYVDGIAWIEGEHISGIEGREISMDFDCISLVRRGGFLGVNAAIWVVECELLG